MSIARTQSVSDQPLRQILTAGQAIWDRGETRPAVRENFAKVIACRTAALGAEVYASETEEKVCPHTCKSRACPSCGYRATLQWQREQWRLLPDIAYVGVVFTMPGQLWPIFKGNRHLLHDLPALGAAVIQHWANETYGLRMLIVVVQHTFGAHLKFNCHLHILVSAGGLDESEGRWVNSVEFDHVALMARWRYAVITFLREALKANVLIYHLSAEKLKHVFTTQYERNWIIKVAEFVSKQHFLQYAARYVRRPPIAQRRILKITDEQVEFWTKDKKERRVVTTRYSLAEFIALLAEQVPDRYRHTIRYFGLWAPAAKGKTSGALFVLLHQERQLRPHRLSWRGSLWKYFRKDPLIDSRGQSMRWVRREKPHPR